MPAAAHSRNNAGLRHDLIAHLGEVARRAADFARPFGGDEIAYAAGLCHDLGKFHPDFQAYLEWCEQNPGKRGPRVDHKAAGAAFSSGVNALLPLLIMAHHGGLKSPTDLKTWLADPAFARRRDEALGIARAAVPALNDVAHVGLPALASATDGELFARMIFSCLVDADFLDTEAHFDATRTALRSASFAPSAMLEALHKERLRLETSRAGRLTDLRRQIADACEAAGERKHGLYRMTVPTGGGKTLAGMGFALRHAATHGKSRIIVAIPYTSITEQTASVYRGMFGADAVLEHHSATRTEDAADDEPTAVHSWQRLAAENWDAPIVVTTTVQLFQSLFGRRTSTSRKLHRIANSVLILDEVQMLPTRYLATILDGLRCLVAQFGVTVLMSTATQPDFTHASLMGDEIAPDPNMTFDRLRRVSYQFEIDPWTWSDAATALRQEHRAMMILNTRRDARSVLGALDGDALHLSTNLCGAHRRDVLFEVRRRLAAGERCVLVSTQVVEAGVDLDFPAVYRAMGPLDRIIQAAGRCNREGRLEKGRVTIFRPLEGGMPPGAYRTATQLGAIDINAAIDLDDPDALGAWFRRFYATIDTDAEGIQPLRAKMDYPEVSRRFRMIEDDAQDVVVPYGNEQAREQVDDAIRRLQTKDGSARLLLRTLQPYTVGLREREIKRALARGFVEPVIDGVWRWTGPGSAYDSVLGLVADGSDDDLLVV